MKLSGDRCQCKACGEFFNSTYAFDRHRRGSYTDRRCLTPLAMSGEGFSKNAGGYWITAKKLGRPNAIPWPPKDTTDVNDYIWEIPA